MIVFNKNKFDKIKNNINKKKKREHTKPEQEQQGKKKVLRNGMMKQNEWVVKLYDSSG